MSFFNGCISVVVIKSHSYPLIIGNIPDFLMQRIFIPELEPESGVSDTSLDTKGLVPKLKSEPSFRDKDQKLKQKKTSTLEPKPSHVLPVKEIGVGRQKLIELQKEISFTCKKLQHNCY